MAFDGERCAVVWEDLGAIRGRLFTPRGEPLSGDIEIAPGTGAAAPRIGGSAATARFLVVWEQAGEIMGRLVARDGTPDAVIVTLNGATGGLQAQPSVAVEPAGGTWLVVWTGPDASGTGVFGRRFRRDLRPDGVEFPLHLSVEGDQRDPAAVWVPLAGRWLAAWTAADEHLTGVRGRWLP